MKNLSIALLVLVAAAIQAETPKNITVTTAEGKQVELTPKEVEKAFESYLLQRTPHAKKIVRNEDGSFTINEPYFQYNGDNLGYHAPLGTKENTNSTNGICRRFGMGIPAIFYFTDELTSTKPLAILEINGKLFNVISPLEKDLTDKKVGVVKSITCPAR